LVEDTTFRKWRRRPPEPRIRLRIADCSNEISLWFELNSQAARENSLHKIDTLLGALQRFREALDAEAELYAHREQHRHQPGRRPTKIGCLVCRTKRATAHSDPNSTHDPERRFSECPT
jgi:hypothetical protein